MINLLENEKIEEYIASFGENSDLIRKNFKFLFVENDELYICLISTNEEEVNKLRKIWTTINSNSTYILNVKKLNFIKKENEKILFLQKAIELFKIKDVKIHL